MFFHPKNLKSENNNPWFNILLHTQSIVCAIVDSQCLEYFGYITLTGGRKLALASQCNAVLALLSFFVKSALASYTPVLKDIHAWILSLLLQCVKKYKAIIILHCKYIYTVKLQWKRDTCKKCTLYKYLPYTVQCRSYSKKNCKSALHLFHCTWSSN